MTRTILIMLMVGGMSGCVSRSQYKRDQEQLGSFIGHYIVEQSNMNNEMMQRIVPLEKKVEERKKPEDNPMLEVTIGTQVYHMRYDELEEQIQNRKPERPNWPCFRCDEETKKMSHFIEKCKICGTTMAQCRCPDPNKEVRWGICEACKAKEPRP